MLASAKLILKDKTDFRNSMDQYLRETVDSSDLGLNMRQAKEWLTDLGPDYSGIEPAVLMDHANFLALDQILGGNYCNETGQAILEYNDRYFQSPALERGSRVQPQDRFNSLVLELSRKHGTECRPIFYQLFFDKYPTLDPEATLRMDTFTDAVIEASEVQEDYKRGNPFNIKISDTELINQAYEVIIHETEDDLVKSSFFSEKK